MYKFFVGDDITSFEDNGIQRPISRVTLKVDDENVLTAGDDVGMELLADCPHATQAMVNAILAQVKGYRYQMFSAGEAGLDPAAELGDGITAGGVYSVISRLSDDGSGYPSVAAPGETELEDEYPAAGPMSREFGRKIAETRSSITKTAEEIRLEVENELAGLSSSISVRLDSITSTVQGQEGAISSLTQKVDSFTLEVSNGKTSSTIQLKAGNAVISSKKIQMDGLVTFTGLSSGTTTIDGACIKTGTIDADRLNLTGALTFGDLSNALQNTITSTQNTAKAAKTAADEAQETVGGWVYAGTTYIDGAQIMTGTVRASKLIGGTVQFLDSSEEEAGHIVVERADSYEGSKLTMYSGALAFVADYGSLYLEGTRGAAIRLDTSIICYREIRPDTDALWDIGRSNRRWNDIYCVNSEIITSDREKKTDIRYGLDSLDELFDLLRPCTYRFKAGRRTHPGLIAQDLEQAMAECGVSDIEYSAFIKSPREDGGFDYGIRYGELIPLLIDQVQKLKQKWNEWEAQYGNKKIAG